MNSTATNPSGLRWKVSFHTGSRHLGSCIVAGVAMDDARDTALGVAESHFAGFDRTSSVETQVEFYVPLFPLTEDDPHGVLSRYRCPDCGHDWFSEHAGAPDSDCPRCESGNIEALAWTEIVQGDYHGAEARLRADGAESEIDPASDGTMVIAPDDVAAERRVWMARHGAAWCRLPRPVGAPAVWIQQAE